jgi:hypothetical protein
VKTVQRERLLSILEIQAQTGKTSRIRAFMRKALEEAGMTVQKRDRQLFAWKGDTNEPVPIFVAHSDTVHQIVAPEKYALGMYTDKGDIIYHAFDPTTRKWRGVGGDDKCGLWVALEAAHALPNIGVIITIDEESGCQGARLLTPEDSAHASVLIQADRRGNDDAVRKTFSGTLSGQDWQDHVASAVLAHGYDWCNFGAATDVAAMKRAVSAINLSAGYYSPHSPNEYVSETDLENCLELAITLAERSGRQRWDHVPVVEAARWNSGTYAYGRLKAGVTEWDNQLQMFYYPDTGEYAVMIQGKYQYVPLTVIEVMGETAQEVRATIDVGKAIEIAKNREKHVSREVFLGRYAAHEYARRCDVLTCYDTGVVAEELCLVLCERHLRVYTEVWPMVVAAKEVADVLGIGEKQTPLALPYSA